MPSPCNSLNVIPIKVSKLVRYKNIDVNDIVNELLDNINFNTFDFTNDNYYNINTFKNLL